MERIGTEQKMTVREVAEALGVSERVIQKHASDMGITENGKKTEITEAQAVEIKRRFGQHDLARSCELNSAVTELEKQETIVKAMGYLQELYTEAKKRAVAAESALQIAAPKAEVYDAFLDSSGLYTIKEAAVMLNVPEFGEKELFRILRLEEVFTRTNKPCVQYQRDGYFVLKASAGGSGSRAMVTPRGIEFIRDLITGSKMVLCAKREAALCNDDGFIVGIRGAGRAREV